MLEVGGGRSAQTSLLTVIEHDIAFSKLPVPVRRAALRPPGALELVRLRPSPPDLEGDGNGRLGTSLRPDKGEHEPMERPTRNDLFTSSYRYIWRSRELFGTANEIGVVRTKGPPP